MHVSSIIVVVYLGRQCMSSLTIEQPLASGNIQSKHEKEHLDRYSKNYLVPSWQWLTNPGQRRTRHLILCFCSFSNPVTLIKVTLITPDSQLPHLFRKLFVSCGMLAIPCLPNALRVLCTVQKIIQGSNAPCIVTLHRCRRRNVQPCNGITSLCDLNYFLTPLPQHIKTLCDPFIFRK